MLDRERNLLVRLQMNSIIFFFFELEDDVRVLFTRYFTVGVLSQGMVILRCFILCKKICYKMRLRNQKETNRSKALSRSETKERRRTRTRVNRMYRGFKRFR